MINKIGFFIFLSTFILTGCMSSNVKWRHGNLPNHKEDWVRFKTNYFFRVINTCEPPKPKMLSNRDGLNSNKYMLSDTLYRFTLTGKASEWSNVKFEAGTLLASQIDPFSSTVTFNKNTNKFDLVSSGNQASINASSEQQSKLSDITLAIEKIEEKLAAEEKKAEKDRDIELISSYRNQRNQLESAKEEIFKFLYGHTKVIPPISLSEADKNSIRKQASFQALTSAQQENFLPDSGVISANSVFAEFITDETKQQHAREVAQTTYSRSDCPPGFSRNHGFLILGPEGWKHFDPEERLLLAMYTSEKPLISTMSELSQKMTQAHNQTRLNEKPYQDEIQRILRSQISFLRAEQEWETKVDELIQSLEDQPEADGEEK
ncbi:hypothetical protein [Vibrio nigripulchritudo]|uniref:hypothetical protein n=1 Tax=Vibrio nigripulchritudo TaxID=28173 RepID=UPI0024930829|nr:hypothetical protein [Vibrio nigripulchritudo]BDU40456.1 hypothetical protein TUMSATVNIG2_49250 [Vibrio nigripulchritudo]BDU46193.1 hypothetical protein TUMSATVNIG3_49910 [Vibrio nigripulchritudo]